MLWAIRSRTVFNKIKIMKLCFMMVCLMGLSSCETLESVEHYSQKMLVSKPSLLAPEYAESTPGSTQTIDHTQWDAFLRTYVITDRQGINRVNYVRVTQDDTRRLNEYIARLSDINQTKLSRSEQLAYWINFYNASVAAIVLDNYPILSLEHVKPHMFTTGPWDDEIISVKARRLSLNDMKNRIIRARWSDPRVLFVLSSGRVSDPNLPKQALTGENLNAVMTEAAKNYVNHRRGVTMTPDGRFIISRLFADYRVDFGKGDDGILTFIRRYASEDLYQKVADVTEINGYQFDDRLNDAVYSDSYIFTR